MDKAIIASPIWRIAAATGEEPADVEAALASLVAHGYTFDQVWDLIEGYLRFRSDASVVAMAARLLA